MPASGSTIDSLVEAIKDLKKAIDDLNNDNQYGGGSGSGNNSFFRPTRVSGSNYKDVRDWGYVGNVGLNPQFSQEIAKLRKEIEENNRQVNDLVDTLDNSAANKEQLTKNLNKLKQKFNNFTSLNNLGFNNLDEALSFYNDIMEAQKNGFRIPQSDLDKANQIYAIAKDIIDTQGKIEVEDKKRSETEGKLNAKKLEGLKLSILEQKKLSEINKELDYRNKKEEGVLSLREKMAHFLDSYVVNTSKLSGAIGEIREGIGKIKQGINEALEPWMKLDQAASDYAKKVGLSGQAYKQFRADVINANKDFQISRNTGLSSEQLISTISDYTDTIGRQVDFAGYQLDAVGRGQFLMGDNGKAFMANLERYGMNMDNAIDKATELFKTSSNAGVAFSKTSKIFLDNIQLAQKYTFREGLDGLAKMAKRSAEIKMNLADVASFVEKTSTLEGSMQAAAGLSVLGGPFALGSNPMSMLYNALNDFEGAGTQIENMVKNLVFFNERTKQLEMSAFNKARLRAAAQATGMNYDSLLETAYSRGRERLIAPYVRSLGYNEGDDEYQMLLNRSYLDKNGEASINVNNQKKSVSKLTRKDVEEIKKSNFSDSDNIKTITSTLLGWDDMVKGLQEGVRAEKAYLAESQGIGEGAKNILNYVRESSETLGFILYHLGIITTLMGIGTVGNGAMRGIRSLGGTRPPNIGGAPNGVPIAGPNLSNATKSQINRAARERYREFYKNAKGEASVRRETARANTFESLTKGSHVEESAARRAVQRANRLQVFDRFRGAGRFAGNAAMLGGAIGGGLITSNARGNLSNGSTSSSDVTWSSVGGGVSGGSTGAMLGGWLGSMLGGRLGGPLGLGIGLLTGAIGGALFEGNAAEKQRLRNIISQRSGITLSESNYSIDELNTIARGEQAIRNNPSLRDKLFMLEGLSTSDLSRFGSGMRNGGLIRPRKLAYGGVLRGIGSGESDDNLTWLSNNEYVMPAKQVLKPSNRKILDAMRRGDQLIPSFKDGGSITSPVGNQMNIMKVSDSQSVGSMSTSIEGGRIDMSPLDVTGVIKLDTLNGSREIDGRELLNNPVFLSKLTDVIAKNIQIKTKMGYDKNNFYKKF